jgi:outer membrane protein TolC
VVPAVPEQVPAGLLLQRPDVAAAERQMAAANARIGIARRAWLPTLSLGTSGALRSGRLGDLIDAPVRVWSLGPALAARLFDGGARQAELERLAAAYDEQASAWRAGVLAAIRETEDALAALRSLHEEMAQQRRLVALADENERVAVVRYEAGEVSFLEVATAQSLAISSRRAALDVEAERLLASMALIAALGGGWQP